MKYLNIKLKNENIIFISYFYTCLLFFSKTKAVRQVKGSRCPRKRKQKRTLIRRACRKCRSFVHWKRFENILIGVKSAGCSIINLRIKLMEFCFSFKIIRKHSSLVIFWLTPPTFEHEQLVQENGKNRST